MILDWIVFGLNFLEHDICIYFVFILICIYCGWGGFQVWPGVRVIGFVVGVNGLKPLTVTNKSSFSDVGLGSESTSYQLHVRGFFRGIRLWCVIYSKSYSFCFVFALNNLRRCHISQRFLCV